MLLSSLNQQTSSIHLRILLGHKQVLIPSADLQVYLHTGGMFLLRQAQVLFFLTTTLRTLSHLLSGFFRNQVITSCRPSSCQNSSTCMLWAMQKCSELKVLHVTISMVSWCLNYINFSMREGLSDYIARNDSTSYIVSFSINRIIHSSSLLYSLPNRQIMMNEEKKC